MYSTHTQYEYSLSLQLWRNNQIIIIIIMIIYQYIIIRAFFQLVALLGAKKQHLLDSTLTLPKLRPPPSPFP